MHPCRSTTTTMTKRTTKRTTMSKFHKFILTACLSLGACAAQATIIGFDDLPDTSTSGQNVLPLTQNGFTFSSSLGDAEYHNAIFHPLVGVNTNGTAVLGWCAAFCGGAKTITITGPGVFSLAAFDIAALVAGTGSGTLTVTGYLAGGGSIARSVSYGDDWITTGLTGFDNLSRLELFSADVVDVAIDNLIVTNAVPEPGSIMLTGIGLAALMASTRRREATRGT